MCGPLETNLKAIDTDTIVHPLYLQNHPTEQYNPETKGPNIRATNKQTVPI